MDFKVGDMVTIIYPDNDDKTRVVKMGESGVILRFGKEIFRNLVYIKIKDKSIFPLYRQQLMLTSKLSRLEKIIYGLD